MLSARSVRKAVAATTVGTFVMLGVGLASATSASAGIFDPQTCATAFDDSYEPGYDNPNPRRGEITNPWDQQYLLADEEEC